MTAHLLAILHRAEHTFGAVLHSLRQPRSALLRYGAAICMVAIGLILTLAIRVALPQTRYLLFYLAVTLSTWFWGLGPGLVATFLTIVGVNYFFQDNASVNVAPIDLLVFVVLSTQAVLINRLQD